MSVQQKLHRGVIQLAVDVLSSQLSLKLADNLFRVKDFDLLDQPIQPQPDGRLADSILFRHRLERSGGEDKSLQKAFVFVTKTFDPGSPKQCR